MRSDASPPLLLIHRHLVERRGLDLSRYKESYLQRRLLVRVRALRLAGLEAYARYLKRHPEEIGPLQRALSIKVTGFFRNRSCFEFLKDAVVPDLVRRAGGRRDRIAVWSAGCATGEEPYSLAALFVPPAGARERVRVRIIATDLDDGALAAARRAQFQGAALLGAVPPDAARHFEVRADGTATPVERLRRMVAFQRESLLDPFERRDLDLIVCRNVLIYFSLDHQREILERFAAALSPGGYLVLGRVERLFGPARVRFEVASARDRVYRRLPEAAACA
jgi:chemotaxis methyl-accepting protein methylase